MLPVRMAMMRLVTLACAVMIGVNSFGQKPKKPHQLLEEAEAAYSDGKYPDALGLLNECLKVNPGYFEAYLLRGNVKELLVDNAGALTDYSIYLEQFPDHRDVLLNRAVVRYKVGFYEQAIEDFNKLLRLPASGETNALFYRKQMSVDDRSPIMSLSGQNSHRGYLYNYLGLCFYKLKSAQAAKVYFDSAIYADNREPDYFVNRGLSKEVLNDSSAFLDYELALRLNPNHTLAKHNLQALKSKKIQAMSLEERLSQTIAADSTMLYPYLERAQQRYESKYYQGAIEDYTSALEIDPGNVEIWLGRGLAREKMKDLKGAFSDYTKAIELKENFAKAWLNRGNVLLKMERYEEAVEDYNVALIYQPEYSLGFYNRAMARVKLKKNQEACEDLKQAEVLGMKIDSKVKSKVCN